MNAFECKHCGEHWDSNESPRCPYCDGGTVDVEYDPSGDPIMICDREPRAAGMHPLFKNILKGFAGDLAS